MNTCKRLVFLELLIAWMLSSVSGMQRKYPQIIGYHGNKNWEEIVYFKLDAATMATKNLTSLNDKPHSHNNLAANSIMGIFCHTFDDTEADRYTSQCHRVGNDTDFFPSLPRRNTDDLARSRVTVSELNPYGDHLVWQERIKGGLFVTNLRSNTSFLLIPSTKRLDLFTVHWNNGIIYLVLSESDREVVKIRIPKLSHVDDMIQMSVIATLPFSNQFIRGLACQSDANETVYWLGWTSLYRATSDGSVVQLLSNLPQLPSWGSLQYYDGFLYWFQGEKVRESKSLIIYDILTGNLTSKPLDLKDRELERLVIYEDKTEGVENGCEKLNCSHICIPFYKSQFQCMCPWGLKLVDGRQCVGTEIATLSNIGASESGSDVHLTWHDLGTGSSESQDIGFKKDASFLLKDKFTWIVLTTENFNFNETSCIANLSINLRPAESSYSCFLPLKSIPAYGSSLEESIHFFVNDTGCLRRLDLNTSIWWTLTCLPELGRGQSALDVDRWILFWEDEGKSGFQTDLMTSKTRPFNLFEPQKLRGREPSNLVALDSHNMKVYLLSFGYLNVTSYDDSDQAIAYRTFTDDGNSFSHLIFSSDRLYWLEHFDASNNDYLVTFDPVFQVKERILVSKGIIDFKVRPEITMKPPKTVWPPPPKCSHFTVPTNYNSFICLCPAEVLALINGSKCISPEFLIAFAPAVQRDDFYSINLRLISSDVKGITSLNQKKGKHTLSNVYFSAFKSDSNEIVCKTVSESAPEQTAIDCDVSDSNEPIVIRNDADSVQLMAIGADGDTIYYQTLHDGCIHLYSLQRAKSFKSVCVNQNLTFAIDTQRHVIFWCKNQLVVYKALGAMGGIASASKREFALSGKCNALAVNEYKAELFIMKRRFIISIEYSNLLAGQLGSNLHEITYKYFEGLQYYADNVFWIGGLYQSGEFIEFFYIQRNAQGKISASFNFQRIFKDKLNDQIVRFQIFEPVVEYKNWLSPCDLEINKCDNMCLITDPIPPIATHSATCLSSEEPGVTTTSVPPANEDTFPKQNHGSEIDNNSVLIITTVVILCVLLVAILVAICVRSQRAKRSRLGNAIADLVKGDPEANNVTTDADTAALAPFTMSIPPEQIHVDRSKVLGSGQFGIVYSGQYNDINVALKTIKCNKNPELRENLVLDFIRELKLMAYIGEHENVVSFYGAEISRIHDGKAYAVIELSPIGSLKAHLKNLADLQLTSQHYINVPGGHDSNLDLMEFSEECKLMMSWARQIACGMRHLEEKRIVHGDLATRNVLVFEGGQTVKLSDFGLSRNLYKSDYYKKYTKTTIPFRWSAIEILEKREFSTKADVWSYGVTIWEIFSFGALPFAQFEWDLEFVLKLKSGIRLPKPKADTCRAYEKIMLPCWAIRGRDRPSFSSIEEGCLNVFNEDDDVLDYIVS